MRFGVVITSEKFGAYATGLLSAAVGRGWICRCFLTDTGVRVLSLPDFEALALSGKLQLTVCELSWKRFGTGAHPPWATIGSQYQNAELAHECDKVLVV